MESCPSSISKTEEAQMMGRLIAIIALALICAGIIVIVNIHEIAPTLTMQAGGH